jgi:hypothetical protein
MKIFALGKSPPPEILALEVFSYINCNIIFPSTLVFELV